MHLEKYVTLKNKLENDELEQNNVNEELYIQLFALHLFQNELLEARYLWKRIPKLLRTNNKELSQLYILWNALSNNNSQEFFKNVYFPWSDSIKTVIDDLKEKTRKDIFELVGKAYTSILESHLMQLTQLTREELKEACAALEWVYENNVMQSLIIPKRPNYGPPPCASSEAQLFRLTEFVSFLEN